jgi:mannose-6-phosphate isomerase-like protein (cupin superfamily)
VAAHAREDRRQGELGHRHKTQEEVYFVASGTCSSSSRTRCSTCPRGRSSASRPEVARSVWNEGPDDAALIMVSTKIDDPPGDVEKVEDFWVE